MACSVQSLVYLPSLSSQLLLRNMPNSFDYYGSYSRCLSSRNRSIFKAFRHILPCIAPVCEGMHYHKTGVPWQTKSTRIIYFFLSVCGGMPCFARFCKGCRDLCDSQKMWLTLQNKAKLSKTQ